MKILLLGTGAAIHALSWKVVSEPDVQQVYSTPGSAGTTLLLGQPPFSSAHGAEIAQWAFSEQVELVVVQGKPAWVDMLAGVGLAVLGADEQRKRGLDSRQHIRDLLRRQGIPCQESRSFWNLDEAERFLASQRLPLRLRPDDASQKGVFQVEERLSGFQELARLLSVDAGAGACIEQAFPCRTVAMALLCDGQQAIPFGLSRPYEHRYEGDLGPLTEGMGAYAPCGQAELEERLMEEIGRPVIAALAAADLLRPAFLHLRILIGEQEALLDDLAWGLDDLHAAVTLPRWDGDLSGVLHAAAHGQLAGVSPRWQPHTAVAVALVSEGYPGPTPGGQPIEGLFDVDGLVFHHATRLPGNALPSPLPWLRPEGSPRPSELPAPVLTAGGRALLVVGQGPTAAEARRRAYAGIAQLEFPLCAWRPDIAAELE